MSQQKQPKKEKPRVEEQKHELEAVIFGYQMAMATLLQSCYERLEAKKGKKEIDVAACMRAKLGKSKSKTAYVTYVSRALRAGDVDAKRQKGRRTFGAFLHCLETNETEQELVWKYIEAINKLKDYRPVQQKIGEKVKKFIEYVFSSWLILFVFVVLGGLGYMIGHQHGLEDGQVIQRHEDQTEIIRTLEPQVRLTATAIISETKFEEDVFCRDLHIAYTLLGYSTSPLLPTNLDDAVDTVRNPALNKNCQNASTAVRFAPKSQARLYPEASGTIEPFQNVAIDLAPSTSYVTILVGATSAEKTWVDSNSLVAKYDGPVIAGVPIIIRAGEKLTFVRRILVEFSRYNADHIEVRRLTWW
jgi:hypothetical protein